MRQNKTNKKESIIYRFEQSRLELNESVLHVRMSSKILSVNFLLPCFHFGNPQMEREGKGKGGREGPRYVAGRGTRFTRRIFE